MEGLITFLHLGAYFLIVSTVFNTERLWNWFWNTTLAASLIMVLYGFLQLSGAIKINQSNVRLDGTFGNATYLAVYMLLHIFIAVFLTLSGRHFLYVPQLSSLKNKLIAGIPLILLQAFILYKTATRGSLLGLIAAVFVTSVLLVLFAKRHPRLRKVSLGFIVAVIVLFGAWFAGVKNSQFVKNSPTLNRFAEISLNDRTTLSRFELPKMAMKGVKERPILGWGQENFNYIFNKYYSPQLYGQEQ